MIPPVEKRQYRPCATCSRYKPEEEGPKKCIILNNNMGPRDASKPDTTRDLYPGDKLKGWPCPDHITHEEFLESVRINND